MMTIIGLEIALFFLWLWFIWILVAARATNARFNIRLSHMRPGLRWILVPIGSLAAGGASFEVLREFWQIFQTHIQPSASSLLAILLVYIWSCFEFVDIGTLFAPFKKIRVCIILTFLLFGVLALMLHFSDMHVTIEEIRFYPLWYSLAGGLAVLAGLLEYYFVLRKYPEKDNVQ